MDNETLTRFLLLPAVNTVADLPRAADTDPGVRVQVRYNGVTYECCDVEGTRLWCPVSGIIESAVDRLRRLRELVAGLSPEQRHELLVTAPESSPALWDAWVHADTVQGHAANAVQLLGFYDAELFTENERKDLLRAVRRRLLAISALASNSTLVHKLDTRAADE